jgi:hypothetical protein
MKYLAIAAMLTLGACTSTLEKQVTVADMCFLYGKALEDLSPFRKDLDAKAVSIVEEVRAQLNPICLGSKPPSAVEAATSVGLTALTRLNGIVAIFKPKATSVRRDVWIFHNGVNI